MILAVVAVLFMLIAMFSPFVILATRTTYMNPMLWMLGGILCAGITFLFFYKMYKRYRTAYKDKVVNRAAETLFDSFSYYSDFGFTREEIAATGIMSMGNRFHSEDMVEGTYKGVPFRRADLYIAQHTSTGKSSHTTVYIRGTWIVFRYNKNFEADLQVASKDFAYERNNASRFFTRSTERWNTIQTEDIEFNNMFDARCQNEVEAFYLLTPRVMQMLKLLRSELGAPIMVGFVRNMLHVAISSGKNHMEPPVFGSINPELDVMKIRTELKAVCNIIDALSMDREIFTGDTNL